MEPFREIVNADWDTWRNDEWLLTNGLGGYASASLSGDTTRRYHGLLISALPAPLGRMVMLSHLMETVTLADGKVVNLRRDEEAGSDAQSQLRLWFRLEAGLPLWRYAIGETVIEKRIVLPYRLNIVYITYRQIAGPGPIQIELSPYLQFRAIEAAVNSADRRYVLSVAGDRCEVTAGAGLPTLHLTIKGAPMALQLAGGARQENPYRIEAERGYESLGPLWSPGSFKGAISKGRSLTLVAGTDPWHTILALDPAEALEFERMRRRRLVTQADPAAQNGFGADLVLAADAFVITPVGRVADRARAEATGDEIRTVIAGYHWFTDWGRDSMITLEGLTLTTGRHNQARWILLTFAHYVRDGLIPNLFPEGADKGLYHTADATPWFFHALGRYVDVTKDRDTLRHLLPILRDIIDHHVRGTRFGIGVDPTDGLLRQGAEGYQLTWMDAKVGDWVVTPRRGKAVEINALWYNALRLMESWLRDEDPAAAAVMRGYADRAYDSFNSRFWYPEGGYLYDVVDGERGDDPACRPNQLFAISLAHPVLDPSRWAQVVAIARDKLVTPVGLRSLSPTDPDYKSHYFGDLRARDAAYHQGTVWAWLIGPFIDAWLKVHPGDRDGARHFLDGFAATLDTAGIGSISEIFDAEPPFTPRGCIAQAWSVAEVLRSWVKTAN